MTAYPCCEHCEHDDGMPPDRHARPCRHGCNDAGGVREAAGIAWDKTHPDPYADWVNGEPPGGAA